MRPPAVIRRPTGEDGSALIEFVGASVILLVPLVYLLLAVFAVQRGAFAVADAAREAGRAFATAPDSSTGVARAQYAADLALADQNVPTTPVLRYTAAGAGCSAHAAAVTPTTAPNTAFTVCVSATVDVAVPLLDSVTPTRVHVSARYAVTIDPFRTGA